MNITFQRHVLNNRSILLTEHIPYARSVAIGIWVGYGSRSESAENMGAAHMIEHMLFKGTADMGPMDIAIAFESVGSAFNAAASKEVTNLYARVLDDHFPHGVRVLSDMALRSVFPADEFDREKQVILEEIKGHLDVPEEMAYEYFYQDFFGPLGLGHDILGTEESIGAMTRDTLFGIYRNAYRPAHLIVSVAGNIEKFDVPAIVLEALGSDSAEACEFLMAPPARPPAESKINLIDRDTHQVQMFLGVPGVPFGHPDRFVFNTIDTILSGGMSSRLFQEVREKRGLVYDIATENSTYKDAGVFYICAGMRPESLEEVLDVTAAELIKMRKGDITEEELERAKQQYRAGMIMSYESVVARMARLARNEIYYGRYLSDEEILDSFNRVSLDDIVRVGEKLFSGSRAVFTALGPFDKKARRKIEKKIVDVLGKL